MSSLCNHNKKFHNNNVNIGNINGNNTVNNVNDEHVSENKYICNVCNKIFSCRQSKYVHQKTICKKDLNDNQELLTSNNKLEKEIIDIKKENIDIKNEKIEDFFISSKKAKLFLQNILKELIEKNCKIHPKTLQKINKQLINNNNTTNIVLNQSNNELKSNDTKIIKSDDNKFQFDLNKNFLTFHDKPIKYFYYNDQIYFKGIDVASMLDYNDTDQAIRKNIDSEDIIIIGELLKNDNPKTVYINESIIKKFLRIFL
jgi:hypothetical protein